MATLTGSYVFINSGAGNIGVAVYVASGTGAYLPDGGSLIWNASKATTLSHNLFSSNIVLSRGYYWYGLMVDNNSTNFARLTNAAGFAALIIQSGGAGVISERTYTTTAWTFSSNCPTTIGGFGPTLGLCVAVLE
jgi:hypothetical protein